MPEVEPISSTPEPGTPELRRRECPFGPDFFVVHLRRFVRDRCPSPGESLPHVSIHLIDGEILELCHVVALSTCWVGLAVFDGEPSGPRTMRTDIVPYPTIQRIVVRASPDGDARAGYELDHEAAAGDAETAERLLAAASGTARAGASNGVTWLEHETHPHASDPGHPGTGSSEPA